MVVYCPLIHSIWVLWWSNVLPYVPNAFHKMNIFYFIVYHVYEHENNIKMGGSSPPKKVDLY